MGYSWDLDGGEQQKVEFTKFPVGTTRIRVLDKMPFVRWTHWIPGVTKDGKGRSINCPGMKVCPIDDIINREKANGMKPRYSRTKRYAMNIFNYETGRIEIMEQGKTFMEDLKLIRDDLKEEGKELSDVILKVRRTGTSKDDTKYRIDVLGDATEEMPKEGITDLAEYFKPHTPEQINRILAGEKWEDVFATEETESKTDNDEDIELR